VEEPFEFPLCNDRNAIAKHDGRLLYVYHLAWRVFIKSKDILELPCT
jgi:hypothetical protein